MFLKHQKAEALSKNLYLPMTKQLVLVITGKTQEDVEKAGRLLQIERYIRDLAERV
jgi:hypothetical protein